jgi:hypothetical protein
MLPPRDTGINGNRGRLSQSRSIQKEDGAPHLAKIWNKLIAIRYDISDYPNPFQAFEADCSNVDHVLFLVHNLFPSFPYQ